MTDFSSVNMILVLVMLLFAHIYVCQELPINTNDISSINNLDQKSRVVIDERIRKALFNVLTRLEKNEVPSDTTLNNNTVSNTESSEKNSPVFQRTTTLPTTQETKPTPQIKWEYITNGTLEEFNVKEAIKEREKSSTFSSLDNGFDPEDSSKIQTATNISATPLEQEALFFKIGTRPQKKLNKLEEKLIISPKMESLTLEESNGIYNKPVIDYLKQMISTVNAQPQTNTTENEYEDIKARTEKIIEENKIDKKEEKLKHDVEFFKAPLVAAFTLQHDEFGFPKKVIPLNDVSKNFLAIMSNKLNQEILYNNNIYEEEYRQAREQQRQIQNGLDKELLQQYSGKNKAIYAPYQELQTNKQNNELYTQFQRNNAQNDIEKQLQELLKKKQELEAENEQFLLESQQSKKEKFNLETKPNDLEYYRVRNQESSQRPIDFQQSVEFVPSSQSAYNFPQISNNQNVFSNKQTYLDVFPKHSDISHNIEYTNSRQNQLQYTPFKNNHIELQTSKPNLEFQNKQNYREYFPNEQRYAESPANKLYLSKQVISEFPAARHRFSDFPHPQPNFFEFPSRKPSFSEFQTSNKPFVLEHPSPNIISKQSDTRSPVYRGTRNEPQIFVGNGFHPQISRRPNNAEFEYHPSASNIIQRPDIVDKRLQSLIYQSGISNDARYEDLNLVSKVLALGHKGESNKSKERDHIFAESSNMPHVVSAPTSYRFKSLYNPYVTLHRRKPGTKKRNKSLFQSKLTRNNIIMATISR